MSWIKFGVIKIRTKRDKGQSPMKKRNCFTEKIFLITLLVFLPICFSKASAEDEPFYLHEAIIQIKSYFSNSPLLSFGQPADRIFIRKKSGSTDTELSFSNSQGDVIVFQGRL